MKPQHYRNTDSLYVEFTAAPGVKTHELTDGPSVDPDAKGSVAGFDINHALRRLDLSTLKTTALPLQPTRAG